MIAITCAYRFHCLSQIMKSILLASALLVTGLSAADHVAIHPVPREGGWMKRHESFNETSKKGEAKLVFLGDSITQGWEGAGKETWAKMYATRAAANFGIGGDRTEHVLWRLQNGNFDGLTPKLIVLMIGTNNTGHVGRAQKELNGAIYECSAEQTAEGVKTIVESLKKKAPAAKILVLGIFPRGEKPTDKMRQQNEATNAIVAKLADGQTVHYMDIGKTFLLEDGTLPRDIMPDLLHLSPAGYQKWAEAIDPKIKELLGE